MVSMLGPPPGVRQPKNGLARAVCSVSAGCKAPNLPKRSAVDLQEPEFVSFSGLRDVAIRSIRSAWRAAMATAARESRPSACTRGPRLIHQVLLIHQPRLMYPSTHGSFDGSASAT